MPTLPMKLHLGKAATPNWKSLSVYDQLDRMVGLLTDAGEEYIYRYEVKLDELGRVVAERDIAEALESAEAAWNDHLTKRRDEVADDTRVQQALDSISIGIRSLFDELQMWRSELTAELHRDVRKPQEVNRITDQVLRLTASLKQHPIVYRDYRVAPYQDTWGVWLLIDPVDGTFPVAKCDTLADCFDFVDRNLLNGKSKEAPPASTFYGTPGG